MIILDCGSGNGKGNDIEYQKELIDSIQAKDVIIKYQLFLDAPPNKSLKREVFKRAYNYAKKKGIQVTASVFDEDSLLFLQDFEVPFIKIACRQECYKLARLIKTPMIISYPAIAEMGKRKLITPLCCVSRYPAMPVQYEKNFTPYWLSQGISDHTEGFDLYHKYQPEVYEFHYVLERDKKNPDAGKFAKVPKDLEEL
jgi:sialic acid synthase SpsE